MTVIVTYAMVLSWARQARDSKPEGFTYEKPEAWNDCAYVHEELINAETNEYVSVPGCIVGMMFSENEVRSLDWLKNHEGNNALTVIKAIELVGDYAFTDQAKKFLTVLQASQDDDYTWADAIEKAVKFTERESMRLLAEMQYRELLVSLRNNN